MFILYVLFVGWLSNGLDFVVVQLVILQQIGPPHKIVGLSIYDAQQIRLETTLYRFSGLY